jgi:hypothetical protein
MDGGLSLRNSTTMWRWAVLCCVIVGGMFTGVAGASAKGGTNVAGLYEFHAYGITAAEPDRGETLQLVGRFQLAQQIGNVLGGALGDGPCDTGNGQSTMDILGSSSGSSVTFTATALFPLECVLTFTGTLAGETLEGTWKIELFGGSDCGEDEACEGKFKAQRFQKLPTEEEEIEAKEAKEKKEKEEAEKRKKEEEEENADDEEPSVTSVTDQSTGTNSGSILGGDTLIVKGSGFKLSDDEEAEVQFYLGSKMVASSEVTPTSGSEIEVEAPKLASSAKGVPEGATGLALDVRVQITYENEDGETETVKSLSELNGTGPDVFEALIPKVGSVIDEASDSDQGPIFGGQTLQIDGSGFDVPQGDKATVSFELDGEVLGESVEVTPHSATEIEVKAPDLAKYDSRVAAASRRPAFGGPGVALFDPGLDSTAGDLVLEVFVAVQDAAKDLVSSPAGAGDAYDEDGPYISSVANERTGNKQGSILGGETLKIEGSGFEVPEGGEAKVEFYVGATRVKTVAVQPQGSSLIEFEAPDLSSLQSDIPDGKAALVLGVVVTITDEDGDEVKTKNNDGSNVYEALLPQVASVEDQTTKASSGPLLGHDMLKITGVGFYEPPGYKIEVSFYFGEEKLEEVDAAVGSSTEIEVESPDLAKYASKIPAGESGLKLDLVVAVGDGTSGVMSASAFDGEGADAYDALIPVVTSVTDVQMGKSSGSILGGDTLKIEGENFGVPAGAKAAVAFVYGGTYVKTLKDVVPVSSTVIEVEAPDLASLAKEIPDGKDGLATDVVVGIGTSETDQVQSQTEGTGEGPDAYEARRPMITSVTDVQTGKNSGSILGGDTLKIEGENFNVPAGGKAGVAFVHGGIIKTLKVEPVSSTVIEVQAPDLASLAKEIPDGKDGLALDLVIATFDGEGNEVQSPTEGTGEGPDSYDALIPTVDSVTDVQTGKSSGSILGGDTLKIEGENLGVPAGGKATVGFALPGGGAAEGSQVTPLSSTAIQVTDPNLTAFAKNIGQGQLSLLTDVTVTISDAAQATVSSPVTAADRFSFQVLTITSGEAATFTVGKHGSFAVSAEGAGTVALKESGALPEGVSFVDNGGGSGALAGIPAAGTAGVYEFAIAASNGVEPEVTQNFTLTVNDVPTAPGNVEALAGVDSAVVSWSPPASDGQSPIQSYVVTASPGGASVSVDGSGTSATVEGLQAGTAYTFSVAAKNALGNGEAGVSNSVVATSTPIEDPQSATSSTPDGSASTEPVTAADGTTITADADGEGTIDVGAYSKDPVAELGDATSFFDVATTPQSSFTGASFKICGVGASSSIKWWNPATETWQPVSNQTTPSGTPTCVTVTVNTTTSPSLAELYGTVFAVLTQPASTETSPGTQTSSTPPTPAPSTPTQSAKPASGSISLVGSEITVASNGRAAVKLTCTGNATCSGEFTLTVEGKASKAKQRHAKAQTIGTASFSIPAGETVAIKLTLNAAGLALLNTAHGHLGATLTIHQSSPAPSSTRTNNIDLVKLPPHTAPHVRGHR